MRIAIVAGALLGLAVLLAAHAPIAQLDTYHHFADQRTLLGVPNFWNVASNLAFLLVGALGLLLLMRKPVGAVWAWATLFAGAVLVAAGSAYYHWAPSDATLVWDRAPMAVAFAGFFAAIMGEHTGKRGERCFQLLLPAFVLGAIGAVYWWLVTGDLSPWIFVQAAPMLTVMLVLALLPSAYSHRRYLAYGLACYALAKLFEMGDHHLLRWSAGILSGHMLKHLAAAGGIWCFYRMLRLR